ncbi:hypothetical protein N431DRAFT_465720 [Stipitochalara longipes BDJ]|nr:hypothetical protein N431DRAFT_465720 [Stipitochalara longipes BDJ]
MSTPPEGSRPLPVVCHVRDCPYYGLDASPSKNEIADKEMYLKWHLTTHKKEGRFDDIRFPYDGATIAALSTCQVDGCEFKGVPFKSFDTFCNYKWAYHNSGLPIDKLRAWTCTVSDCGGFQHVFKSRQNYNAHLNSQSHKQVVEHSEIEVRYDPSSRSSTSEELAYRATGRSASEESEHHTVGRSKAEESEEDIDEQPEKQPELSTDFFPPGADPVRRVFDIRNTSLLVKQAVTFGICLLFPDPIGLFCQWLVRSKDIKRRSSSWLM